jgi:parallel beta-helix repeat protein
MNKRPMLVLAWLPLAVGPALAGPIDPPAGPVQSTMKSLADIEPRIAINAVNTPGDNDASPSLYKITQQGSYYLTGDVAGVAGKICIEIEASRVTIDLGGYSISGGLVGIGSLTQLEDVAIRDGRVRLAEASGVLLQNVSRTRMDHLVAESCFGKGFLLGTDAIVSECTAESCTDGFDARDGSIFRSCLAISNSWNGFIGSGSGQIALEQCVARQNGNIGIGLYAGSVSRCLAVLNVGPGISAGGGATVETCSASQNGGDGIRIAAGSIVQGSTSERNGGKGIVASLGSSVLDCTSRFNLLDGIEVNHECTVRGNTCSRNGQTQQGLVGCGVLVTGASNRIEDNQLSFNDYGVKADGADNFIARNTARGNAQGNFAAAPGNELAPVVNNPGANGFSTMAPWSNVGY